MAERFQKPVLLIAGPTASGKSALALAIAQRANGEIINADASQLYADLQILSARPTLAEMQDVPHHLFGTKGGAQACSAAAWAGDAKTICTQIWARGKLPIIVGGTGLYLRTLLSGIADVPEIPDSVRTDVRALDLDALDAALQQTDSEAAARLNYADRQRRARALEVVRATGKTLAHWQQQTHGGILADKSIAPILRTALMPERDWLYARCDARFQDMLARGALDEVRYLRARQLPPSAPVMKALGVPELARHLAGAISLAEATAAAQQSTRNYAKRQLTWLRHQFPDWIHQQSHDSATQINELAIMLLNNGLTVK